MVIGCNSELVIALGQIFLRKHTISISLGKDDTTCKWIKQCNCCIRKSRGTFSKEEVFIHYIDVQTANSIRNGTETEGKGERGLCSRNNQGS